MRAPALRPALLTAAVVLALVALLVPPASEGAANAEGPPDTPETRQVMFVGNNWDGTADVIDERTYERIARFDVIPDYEERMAEIRSSPDKLAFFTAIRQGIGEGNDQFVDDMFSNHEGTLVAISRPSFADVIGMDLATGEIVWRFPMEGYRSDHMGVSPDGTTLLVSDSTANKVHVLELATGEKVNEFDSGDTPHENEYTRDGSTIFHASIGRVYTPTDRAALGLAGDTSKGDRVFQVVDAQSYEILERYDMGERLAAAGFEDFSSAVRPMAIAPDEKTVYMQVSFHHGFVEFDVERGEVTRVAELPISEAAQELQREQYVLDSAHHGLAINGEGTRLCAAGTVSDYAAIVDVDDFDFEIASEGSKPYWSTSGADGTTCWVSYSGSDEIAVIDYATAQEITRVPVGDHPQRIRVGVIRDDIVADAAAITADIVPRRSGPDRYGTAADAALAAFPGGADTVCRATGEDVPDALAAGPVAGRAPGPVLLTQRGALTLATSEALEALAPEEVVVLGGPGAVADAALTEVAEVTGARPERIAGGTRVETAALVAERFAPDGAPVVYVANGGRVADALAGGPAAGVEDGVLLLVGEDEVPEATARELRRLAPQRIVVLGGTAVVSEAVATELEDLTASGGRVERLAGADRVATAAAVAAAAFPESTTAYVANGGDDRFPDALAGNPPAIADGAPILLVQADAVPEATAAQLRRLAPGRITVLGGTAVVTKGNERALEAFVPLLPGVNADDASGGPTDVPAGGAGVDPENGVPGLPGGS